MFYKCEVEGCEEWASYNMVILRNQIALCQKHNKEAWKTRKQFDVELQKFVHKYCDKILSLPCPATEPTEQTATKLK